MSILVRAVDGIDAGVHQFVPAADGLELVRWSNRRPDSLPNLFMGQQWVADAAFVDELSAVTERTPLSKYHDPGHRYPHRGGPRHAKRQT